LAGGASLRFSNPDAADGFSPGKDQFVMRQSDAEGKPLRVVPMENSKRFPDGALCLRIKSLRKDALQAVPP
jgi:hypothetical protein